MELTKELEQETLYVEYLERLLNEVEKYRDNGSNAALIFDAATPTINTSNRVSMNEKNGPTTDNKDTEEQQQQQVRRKRRRKCICKLSGTQIYLN